MRPKQCIMQKNQQNTTKGWPGGQIEQLETRRCTTTTHSCSITIKVQDSFFFGWVDGHGGVFARCFDFLSIFEFSCGCKCIFLLFPTDSNHPACLFHSHHHKSTIVTTTTSSLSLLTSLPISTQKPTPSPSPPPPIASLLPFSPFSFHFS